MGMLTVGLVLVFLAVCNALVSIFWNENEALKNTIEWDFAVLMHVFLLFTAWAWSQTGFSVNFQCKR